jgi:hypothetical protein
MQASESSLADTLVSYGGEVKALEEIPAEGQNPARIKVAGYAVLFGDPSTPDLTPHRDYFTKSTYYALDVSTKGLIRYHHCLDPKIGRRILGMAEMKADDVGIWAEGWMEIKDRYDEKVAQWVKERKAGWSTGVAPHCLGRKAVGGAHEITEWPLGHDLSITLVPTDPRQSGTIVHLKSLVDVPFEEAPPGSVPAPSLLDRLETLVSDASEVKALVEAAVISRGDRGLSHVKAEAVKGLNSRLVELYSAWKTLVEGPAVPGAPETDAVPASPAAPAKTPELEALYQRSMATLARAKASAKASAASA